MSKISTSWTQATQIGGENKWGPTGTIGSDQEASIAGAEGEGETVDEGGRPRRRVPVDPGVRETEVLDFHNWANVGGGGGGALVPHRYSLPAFLKEGLKRRSSRGLSSACAVHCSCGVMRPATWSSVDRQSRPSYAPFIGERRSHVICCRFKVEAVEQTLMSHPPTLRRLLSGESDNSITR